jgi:nitroreductase
VDFADTVARRRMVRDFDPARPLDPATVDALIAAACRAPSAGNSQGWDFVVLEGPTQTARFWDVSLPPARRATFAWPGLLDAPVLVCPVADPGAYVARYAEADKATTGLGAGEGAWAFPYWLTDTAFATMVLLLAATDAGLGACFFGLFERAPAVASALGIPDGRIPIGMVALGHPVPGHHAPGRSATRRRRSVAEVVHRGGW